MFGNYIDTFEIEFTEPFHSLYLNNSPSERRKLKGFYHTFIRNRPSIRDRVHRNENFVEIIPV